MSAATLPVDTGLLDDIKRYGAADVSACFSCGVCTATCPLVDNDSTFPRRMIRYAQVGLRDKLLSSHELWACYACGECSDSCPTQAEPSEFMAAARRYAIAQYDRTGIARTMFTHPFIGITFALALAAFFALFMYSAHGPMEGDTLDIFRFIPEGVIHDVGVVTMIVVFLAGLLGVATMTRRVGGQADLSVGKLLGSRQGIVQSIRAAWQSVVVESLGQRRYRADCAAPDQHVAWFRQRWFVHALTMWGFLGLLAATILDYGLALAGIKETGTPVPIWYPVRLLGTLAGLALVYGATMLIWRRYRRVDRSVSRSTTADWLFLALVWISGVSGFAIELALYLPEAPTWGYWMFLFHVAVAMELVLLAPFIKFAHAVYRPLALFFRALAAEVDPSSAAVPNKEA